MELDQAKAEFESKLEEGTTCPCCRRFTKVYKRPLHAGMARFLWWLVRKSGEVRDRSERGGDYAKLLFWGLIEASETRNFFRPTVEGQRFVRGEITVPKYAHVYDGVLLRKEGPGVFFKDCVGKSFDLHELLAI
jgi:hypothetical protein